MQAEWAQMRACKCHWSEEFLIVQEEMCRVLAFFEWKSGWWSAQANRRGGPKLPTQSGAAVHAQKQAKLPPQTADQHATHRPPTMKKEGTAPTRGEKYKVESTAALTGDNTSDSKDEDDEIVE